jgi:hypothetical protein
MVPLLTSAKDTFELIFQVGAGTGLLYLLRWFWWRINAWCEVNAMISSFGLTVLLLIFRKFGILAGTKWGFLLETHWPLIITIVITTVTWVATAYLSKPTDRHILISFYKKVLPFGPGWRRISREAGVSALDAQATHENIPLALLGWFAGSTVIWSSLFAVGSILYGRTMSAIVLTSVFVGSGLLLIYVMNRLWDKTNVRDAALAELEASRR